MMIKSTMTKRTTAKDRPAQEAEAKPENKKTCTKAFVVLYFPETSYEKKGNCFFSDSTITLSNVNSYSLQQFFIFSNQNKMKKIPSKKCSIDDGRRVRARRLKHIFLFSLS